MDLQDIKLQNYATGGGANFICLLDENGMVSGYYEWWTTDDGADEDCWFDGDAWEKITGVTITTGQGFYLYAEDAGLQIQSAGKVKLTDYATPISTGYNLVGNASPVDLDLQQLTLEGVATGGGANFICLLDGDGMVTGYYEWWTTDDGCDEDCWFDGDAWEKISDVTIKAGEGLYFYAEDDGITLKFPSAIK